jgi:hypothetical protein
VAGVPSTYLGESAQGSGLEQMARLAAVDLPQRASFQGMCIKRISRAFSDQATATCIPVEDVTSAALLVQ